MHLPWVTGAVDCLVVVSCAAGGSTYLTLLVLSGTLAQKVYGGHRVLTLPLQTLMTSTCRLLASLVRQTTAIVTMVSPSAAFCASAVGADLFIIELK